VQNYAVVIHEDPEPEQIRALRDSCRGDWTFALIELALATAARRGELLALQWSDIDWTSGLLTISKSLEPPFGAPSRQCRKHAVLPHVPRRAAPCIRPTPMETASTKLKYFECLASTGVNTP
jgi:hypothetical protein